MITPIKKIAMIQKKINNRPRLNFVSPQKEFYKKYCNFAHAG